MAAAVPSLSEIRDKTFQALGRCPCLWQLKAVEAVLKQDRDVVAIAGTGSGKQWRMKCDICTLWQCFGRSARDLSRTAMDHISGARSFIF
ncbi:hypothetical protein BV25DRAFT_1824491 [Artomyces pyxidatus]|uniref:Uncharacterized protein n=1 Tax=Artomyces pyxidatus TaxID=48021 RepID=A0ACB8T545_9AGAM|nr:hypothetical protein BV25DRAFT_1824491 [Artomyces pyxidatus]